MPWHRGEVEIPGSDSTVKADALRNKLNILIKDAKITRSIKKGELLLGWSIAKVQLLEDKPIQCYRYTSHNCKSEIDRSGNCFRCGSITHRVQQCDSTPSCVLCKETGFPHSHRLGTGNCQSVRKYLADTGRRPLDNNGSNGR